MPLNPVAAIVRVIRGIDRLFENVEKLQTGLERLSECARVLEDRSWSPKPQPLRPGAVMQHLLDMSRRIGALEAG